MPLEIERKFLVQGDGWRSNNPVGVRFCQGYLADERARVRVRRAGDRACLTIKGARRGIARPEYEYVIPTDEAEELLRMCRKPLIEKTRYTVPYGGHDWSVDVFAGRNGGLVMAEIELSHPDEPFARPDWLDREVTHEPRFSNSSLVVMSVAGAGRLMRA